MAEYVVGITGASGGIYAIRLIHELLMRENLVNVVITDAGRMVMKEELGVDGFDVPSELGFEDTKEKLKVWSNNDFSAPFMSGSNSPDGVIITPCSMGKLGAIAAGISTNLLERAADVALKERRRLILVVRETPLNLIHIENMAKVTRAGGVILPATPAFYQKPESVADMIDFITGKVLDMIGIQHDLYKKWGE